MNGRAKRGFWADDGRWIQYWQSLSDPPEPEQAETIDYTPELILAMSVLTEKQQFVIRCRYGLYGGPGLTVREIADLMGTRYQSVWEMEQGALKRLKKYLTKIPMGAMGE